MTRDQLQSVDFPIYAWVTDPTTGEDVFTIVGWRTGSIGDAEAEDFYS